jgi:hypothetical protein
LLIDNVKIVKLKGYKYPNLSTIVDKEDYNEICKYDWCPQDMRALIYVSGVILGKNTKLHRFIMELHGFDITGKVVDHIDHNTLNNTKSNLRICTPQENSFNRKKTITKTSSKFKGVYFHKKDKKFHARISHNKTLFHLGCFEHENEAAVAYNTKALELFGMYALLNDIEVSDAVK